MTADILIERFSAARSDTDLMQSGIWAEEVMARGYAIAARSFDGRDRTAMRSFAIHERKHSQVFATLLLALTVPVRVHAAEEEVDALLPGLRTSSRTDVLRTLASFESAKIDAYLTFARLLDARNALRSVAMVMAGAAQHRAALNALTDAGR